VIWEQLAEEIFFFQYHMHLDMSGSMSLPINLRKWMIERFIQQKENENKSMEAQQKKANQRSR
jgi:hypothetical protein